MELEELKSTWNLLNNRMMQKEVMEATIIREMLVAKSDKALSKVTNYDYLGIIICMCFIGLLTWQMNRIYFGPFKTGIFLLAIALLIVSVLRSIKNLFILHKINFSNPISDNIRLVQNYNIIIKRTTIINYSAATGIVVLAIIAGLMSPNMEVWRWVGIAVSIVIGIIGAWWEYRHMYRKNIDSILKSLDESKELEE